MAKAKKIVRREWTKADVKQLRTMAKARVGVTKISKSLKKDSGRYLRDGGQAWRVVVDATVNA